MTSVAHNSLGSGDSFSDFLWGVEGDCVGFGVI